METDIRDEIIEILQQRIDALSEEAELLLRRAANAEREVGRLRFYALIAAASLKEALIEEARASFELRGARAEARASKKERFRSLRRDLDLGLNMEID